LTKKYPNLEMQAELHTTSPPKATFSHDGIRVAGPGQVVVSVLPHGGAPVPVFALNIDLTTSAKVHHLRVRVRWCVRVVPFVNVRFFFQVTVRDGRIFTELSYLQSPITVAVRTSQSQLIF
jgi:hypothetical protein